MDATIGRMVSAFESGRMTRRQLIAGLSGLVAVAASGGKGARAQSSDSLFQATELNHIALRVTDIPRSRDFYVKYLGLTVDRESAGSCFLTCGPRNFVALFGSDTAALDHYCYSIEDYDVREAEAKLKEAGFDPRVHGNRIYFDDPDGHVVQLASTEHMPT